MAWWRQLVHEEAATIFYTDVTVKLTWVIEPMKTHSSLDNPFSHCGMPAAEPPRSMRTTMVFWHNLSSHLLARSSGESVPRGLGEVVTFYNSSVEEAFLTVGLSQVLVV